MGWYEKNYDIEVQPGGMSDVNPFRNYMQDFMHTTSESKMNLGEPRSAIWDFDQALNLGYMNPELYHKRGEAYLMVNEYELALTDINKALSMGLQNADLYLLK